LIIFIFGEYFSGMYFRASIASKLYLHKKSGCDKNVHDHGNKKKISRAKKYKEDPLDD